MTMDATGIDDMWTMVLAVELVYRSVFQWYCYDALMDVVVQANSTDCRYHEIHPNNQFVRRIVQVLLVLDRN